MKRFILTIALVSLARCAFAADALPTFEQEQYPGATRVGEMTIGGMSTRQFETADDLARVVEFYKAKFPKQQVVTEDGAFFGQNLDDGSAFTVTLSRSDGKTQILLMRQDRPKTE